MTLNPEQVVDSILAAIENNDFATVGSLTADDAKIWHSYDGFLESKEEGMAGITDIAVLGTVRCQVLERLCVGDSVAQRHELIIETWDKSRRIVIPVAIFVTVRNGQIVKIDEFIESSLLTELGLAIGAAAGAVEAADV